MYEPGQPVDRTLTNGHYDFRPDVRDYNAPVTGDHPGQFIVPKGGITPDQRKASELAREILLPDDPDPFENYCDECQAPVRGRLAREHDPGCSQGDGELAYPTDRTPPWKVA